MSSVLEIVLSIYVDCLRSCLVYYLQQIIDKTNSKTLDISK